MAHKLSSKISLRLSRGKRGKNDWIWADLYTTSILLTAQEPWVAYANIYAKLLLFWARYGVFPSPHVDPGGSYGYTKVRRTVLPKSMNI